MNRNEIEKRVYERYPVTKKERSCMQEREKRNYLRGEFKKKLIQEGKEKREY